MATPSRPMDKEILAPYQMREISAILRTALVDRAQVVFQKNTTGFRLLENQVAKLIALRRVAKKLLFGHANKLR